ncbi:hypothetical protein DFJ77DRAFT_463072 [Powellomyces hirtus]|nr:hypothetical protein DFJ77DRAFT_463072 [Powellomyces hirtus]
MSHPNSPSPPPPLTATPQPSTTPPPQPTTTNTHPPSSLSSDDDPYHSDPNPQHWYPHDSSDENDTHEYAADDHGERYPRHREDGEEEEDDDDDDDDQEFEDAEGGAYWCHQCSDEISPLMDSGTPTCPHCHSEFVEEIHEESDPRHFIGLDEDDDEHHHHLGGHPDTGEFIIFDHPHADGTGGGGILHGGPDLAVGGGAGGAGQPQDVSRLLQGWLQQVLGNAANGITAAGPARPATTRPATIHTPSGEEGAPPAAEAIGETAGAHAAAAEDNPAGTPHTGARPPQVMAGVFPAQFPLGPRGYQISRATGGGGLGMETPVLDLTAVLEGILGVVGPNGEAADNPFRNLFNMVGNPGDYVFGQRGLDDIISQLMEQTGQRNAPPPASTALIAALPEIKIAKSDLVHHAECSVCQDEYTEGETVTALPCKHLFHPPCIENWLKVNGTCPVCRFSLVDEEGSGSTTNNGDSSTTNRDGPVMAALD